MLLALWVVDLAIIDLPKAIIFVLALIALCHCRRGRENIDFLCGSENMDIFEAIHTRQTIGQVRPDPIPRELIEKILAAAVQAPNHHKVRPWRFIVLTGLARERLGEVMAASFRKRAPDATGEMLAAERAKPLRAPLLIAVGVDKPSEPKVVEIENI